MVRTLFAAAALAACAAPAAAGEPCRGDCYREAWIPPTYGVAVEQVVVRAPRTMALVTPAEYRTVRERVMVRPGGRVWTVTRGPDGRRVGCWVDTPPEYATVSRRVMVRAPEVVPYAQTAAYGLRSYPVQVEPARAGWVPLDR